MGFQDRWDKAASVDNNALILGRGTSTNQFTTTTASAKFIELRCKSSATSGDNRLMYLRYELASTGGGECIRAFTKIQGTIGTALGAHISIDFDATVGDKVTGMAAGLDCQLILPNKVVEAGVGAYTALNVEIYSAGATTDAANCNKLSFIRIVNGGDATGLATVDDDAFLLDISGGSTASGNMMAAKTSSAVSHGLRCRIHGVTYYLMVSDAQ